MKAKQKAARETRVMKTDRSWTNCSGTGDIKSQNGEYKSLGDDKKMR
jgi:hypothetical protein